MSNLGSKLKISSKVLVAFAIISAIIEMFIIFETGADGSTLFVAILAVVANLFLMLVSALVVQAVAEIYERTLTIYTVGNRYNRIANEHFPEKNVVKSWKCKDCGADNGENDEACRICGYIRK